jgi:hypothetical protein
MRSRSIVKSLDSGQSRFELCHQAFKAIRKLHNPGNRVQDTASDALQRLAGAERQLLSVDPKDGSGAELEVRPDVAIEPPAVATPSEPIAGVPPADIQQP